MRFLLVSANTLNPCRSEAAIPKHQIILTQRIGSDRWMAAAAVQLRSGVELKN
jgi:hypothetical protein